MSAQPSEMNQPAWRAGVRPLSSNELTKPGPFFFLSFGIPIDLATSLAVRIFRGTEDGESRNVDTIWPGVLYCVKKDSILMDIEVANEKGEGAFERDSAGGKETLTAVPTVPGDNRRYLMQTHGQDGVTFIDVFEGLSEDQVVPYVFSKIVRPVTLTPQYLEDKPELQERLKKEGALAIYRQMFDEGVTKVKSREFVAKYGGDLQALYIRAFPAVQEAFRLIKLAADRALNEEDARVNRGLAKGAHYDPRGEYYQYLTGRQGVNTLGGSKEVVVKVDQTGGQAAVAQAQCENCGTMVNLLSDGRLPKICLGCKEPMEQPDAHASVGEPAGSDLRVRETPSERRARLQAEALERKIK